ncbi:unnamed protein product, partial [Heterosigma akashiwo]
LHRKAGNTKFLWHLRMGHASTKFLNVMNSYSVVNGMVPYNSSDNILFCEPCVLAKAKRSPFGLPGVKIKEDRQVCLMDLISADLTGPFSVRSVTGNRYVLILIEHYSDYCWIYPLKNKSQATANIMTLFELLHNQLGTYPNKFRTDRGGEFYNDELQSFLSNKGIIAESGPASTPEYNMKQERKQLFLETMANAQLDASPLTKGYWDLSWVVAVYVSNRLPAHKDKGFLTRFELLWNKKPDVSHIRPFGCVGYCALSSANRKKMNPKAVKAIMVGYAEGRKAYLMLTSQTKKFIVSRDVTFAE